MLFYMWSSQVCLSFILSSLLLSRHHQIAKWYISCNQNTQINHNASFCQHLHGSFSKFVRNSDFIRQWCFVVCCSCKCVLWREKDNENRVKHSYATLYTIAHTLLGLIVAISFIGMVQKYIFFETHNSTQSWQFITHDVTL